MITLGRVFSLCPCDILIEQRGHQMNGKERKNGDEEVVRKSRFKERRNEE